MGVGKLRVSIEMLPLIVPALPHGARIIGSFDDLKFRTVCLAVESESIRHGADLVCDVHEHGLSRTIEVKERQ